MVLAGAPSEMPAPAGAKVRVASDWQGCLGGCYGGSLFGGAGRFGGFRSLGVSPVLGLSGASPVLCLSASSRARVRMMP